MLMCWWYSWHRLLRALCCHPESHVKPEGWTREHVNAIAHRHGATRWTQRKWCVCRGCCADRRVPLVREGSAVKKRACGKTTANASASCNLPQSSGWLNCKRQSRGAFVEYILFTAEYVLSSWHFRVTSADVRVNIPGQLWLPRGLWLLIWEEKGPHRDIQFC
jgi:hypothetical protein